ncbi:MAG TPA: hypothetical protein VMJ65_20380 [Solirubrobacteraceae bacterium]|nr:hypothetical protein [Solirubrobacteraceae bacterium]
MRVTARLPIVVPVLALGIATAGVSGCGSGSVSSAAKAAAGAVSSATGDLTSKTQSATGTAEGQTGTKPAVTTSITNSTSVNAQVTQTTPGTSGSGGGLAWWVWVLIGLVAAGVLVAIFTAGRRRGKSTSAGSPPAPDESGENTRTATR